jgi:hypothetical protein
LEECHGIVNHAEGQRRQQRLKQMAAAGRRQVRQQRNKLQLFPKVPGRDADGWIESEMAGQNQSRNQY